MRKLPVLSLMIPRPVACGLILVVMLTGRTSAADDATQPLARYVPSEGLTVLLEHNGLAGQSRAWKETSAYRMLNETSLGAMLGEITAQVLDRGLQSTPGIPVTGEEVVALLTQMANNGFVVGYRGASDRPGDMSLAVAIRDAARSEVFKRVIGRIAPLNEPAAQRVEQPGGRKVLIAAGMPIRWWYEKDDAVFLVSTAQDANPVIDALDGKIPSALKHPVRIALAKSNAGQTALGLLFVDRAALPPFARQAVELGLDRIDRFEARWGIEGKGIVTSLAVHAPRPRRGLLALLDQPAIEAGTRLNVPKGSEGSMLLSVDLKRSADTVIALLEQSDPDGAASVRAFAGKFQERTGLKLRDDLLGKLGPQMAVVAPTNGVAGSMLTMWFNPPEFGVVAELKDSKSFASTLDRLMESANGELKAAGAVVPPQPEEDIKRGTEVAEFRRLKAPDRGYVLAVPPSVLPTPAGLRPAVVLDVDRGLVAFGTSPATARRALGALVLNGTEAGSVPARDSVVIAQSNPSNALPELLVNLPSIVQFVGIAVSQQRRTLGPRPPRPPFRLQLDPDAIPEVESLRPYLFPSKFTLAADDATIRLSAYQAFPLPVPQLNAGMEAPVLIALLLPAVQAAREAARRAQCVNNLKQIGLAMANYESSFNAFPKSAIVDRQGKPLLSWRVAILPFLEQKPLYDQFKLDEPWDSPHNRELLKLMPAAYGCPPRNPAGEPGRTAYRAFAGADAVLSLTRSTPIAAITDGTSNTLLVVESNEAVPWTKPDDLPYENNAEAQPTPLLGAGSKHPGGFNALFVDGSVRFIKSSINRQTFRALITKSGGEIIRNDGF